MTERGRQQIKWPEGKDFAFSVFDDTDFQTVENTQEVYAFLKDHGFLTTKSVWPLEGKRGTRFEGHTCQNEEYLRWVKSLQAQGFEIALHNVTYQSSDRQTVSFGLKKFREDIGYWPKSMSFHADCQENLYWGEDRLSGLNRLLYNVLTLYNRKNMFQGHIKDSNLFWGDLCVKHITYVRDFVISNINTLKECPYMPYHDKRRPFVPYWFASSEGFSVDHFNKVISEKNQDALEAAGGCCIMYTHFACGFSDKGTIHPRFKQLMKRLSRKNGWFAPVSVILDHLREKNKGYVITDKQRNALERKWLFHKMRVGST